MPFLAAAGALGFAVHLLVGGSEPRTQAPEPERPVEEQLAESPPDNVPPVRATAEPSAGATVWPPPGDAKELDALVASNPEQAMQRLARALPRTERDAQRLKLVEVRALVAQGKVGAARGRAHDYFERWPDGPDVATIQQLTGAHPSR